MAMYDRECKTCKSHFKGGPRAWYCPGCRHERKKAAGRKYLRNRNIGLSRKIGSTDKCEICGNQYTVEGGQQKMCADCKTDYYIKKDREQSLEYYNKNKDVINPIRNKRRRKNTEPN